MTGPLPYLKFRIRHWGGPPVPLLWMCHCVVTSRVGHVLSIQFGDNHVVWSEANYYYSGQKAKKVMFNQLYYSTHKLVNKNYFSYRPSSAINHTKEILTSIYLREQILFGLYHIMQCEII